MSQRRIKWRSIEKDPKKISTKKLEEIIDHNIQWIEMEASELYNSRGSSTSFEERWTAKLDDYSIELEARKDLPIRRRHEITPVMNAETMKDLDPTRKKPPISRVFVRMKESLKVEALKIAAKEKKSLNELMNCALFEYLKKRQ